MFHGHALHISDTGLSGMRKMTPPCRSSSSYFRLTYFSVCPRQTSISLPFITATADGPKHIETNLSRAKFEELASDLLDRCRVPVQQALKDANLKFSDLNEVILVGGSTRIPAVQVRKPLFLVIRFWDGTRKHNAASLAALKAKVSGSDRNKLLSRAVPTLCLL